MQISVMINDQPRDIIRALFNGYSGALRFIGAPPNLLMSKDWLILFQWAFQAWDVQSLVYRASIGLQSSTWLRAWSIVYQSAFQDLDIQSLIYILSRWPESDYHFWSIYTNDFNI